MLAEHCDKYRALRERPESIRHRRPFENHAGSLTLDRIIASSPRAEKPRLLVRRKRLMRSRNKSRIQTVIRSDIMEEKAPARGDKEKLMTKYGDRLATFVIFVLRE